MKMRLLTGWQARFHLVCLLMLLSALAAGAWPGNAHAQAQVSPLPSESVAVEPLQDPVAAAAAPAVAEAAALDVASLVGHDHGAVVGVHAAGGRRRTLAAPDAARTGVVLLLLLHG